MEKRQDRDDKSHNGAESPKETDTMTAVATAPKSKKSGKSKTKLFGFKALLASGVLAKPLAERKELPIGRGGEKVVPRNHALSNDDIIALRKRHKEDGDKLPNPHNKGNYYYIIEALKQLGLDKKHPFGVVKTTIRELMSDKSTQQEGEDGKKTTAWQRFKNKAPATANEDNARDEEGRILQNMEVLQRVNIETSNNPYGYKLMQVGQRVLQTKGACIDLYRNDDGDIFVMLNTDSKTPVNELKRRRAKTEAKSTKPAKAESGKKVKAAKSEKASKPKAARKARKAAETAAPADDTQTATAVAEVETQGDSQPSGDIAETENAG